MMYFLSDLVYGSNLCPPDGTLESNYSAKCPCPPPPERRIVNAIGNRLKTNVIYVLIKNVEFTIVLRMSSKPDSSPFPYPGWGFLCRCYLPSPMPHGCWSLPIPSSSQVGLWCWSSLFHPVTRLLSPSSWITLEVVQPQPAVEVVWIVFDFGFLEEVDSRATQTFFHSWLVVQRTNLFFFSDLDIDRYATLSVAPQLCTKPQHYLAESLKCIPCTTVRTVSLPHHFASSLWRLCLRGVLPDVRCEGRQVIPTILHGLVLPTSQGFGMAFPGFFF